MNQLQGGKLFNVIGKFDWLAMAHNLQYAISIWQEQMHIEDAGWNIPTVAQTAEEPL